MGINHEDIKNLNMKLNECISKIDDLDSRIKEEHYILIFIGIIILIAVGMF